MGPALHQSVKNFLSATACRYMILWCANLMAEFDLTDDEHMSLVLTRSIRIEAGNFLKVQIFVEIPSLFFVEIHHYLTQVATRINGRARDHGTRYVARRSHFDSRRNK